MATCCACLGETDVDGAVCTSTAELLDRIWAAASDGDVFIKDTPVDRAPYLLELAPDMHAEAIGLRRLAALHDVVVGAGCPSIVASALTWQAGPPPEWRRSARWHVDVSDSTGFRRSPLRRRAAPPPEVADWVALHRPAYERLRACARTGAVSSVFVQTLGAGFEHALRMLEAAIEDCPDDLWEGDLWPDAPTGPTDWGGIHGSAPWFLGYHALSTLDYDLSGEMEGPWQPPAPITHVYGSPDRVFTKAELLGYLAHCRAKVDRTLAGLDDDVAAQPLPTTHRHHPRSYAELLGGMPLHTVEHAAQLRQHLTASGVRVRPLPGDREFTAEG